MSNWSWKAGLLVAAIVGATAYAIAQMGPGMQGPMSGMSEVMQRHHQMMQGRQGMHGPMMEHHAMMMGQGASAYHAWAGRVRDHPGSCANSGVRPTTDWSKVNIAALREHLIDMDEVTLRAEQTNAPLITESRLRSQGMAAPWKRSSGWFPRTPMNSTR